MNAPLPATEDLIYFVEDGIADRRSIRTGAVSLDAVEIVSGAKVGDRIGRGMRPLRGTREGDLVAGRKGGWVEGLVGDADFAVEQDQVHQPRRGEVARIIARRRLVDFGQRLSLDLCGRIVFAENRFPLFRTML